jgi:hypothetical protein
MQSKIMDYTTNSNRGNQSYVTRAENIKDNPPGLRAAYSSQCRNQRTQSSREVQSFSFLGLTIVVCITVLLAVIALSLEQCVGFCRRRTTSHRKTAWQIDSKLHLLRTALGDQTEVGAEWVKGHLDVPITTLGMEIERPNMHSDGLGWYRQLESKEHAEVNVLPKK